MNRVAGWLVALALLLLSGQAEAHALAFSKGHLVVARSGAAELRLTLDLRRLVTGPEPGDLSESQFEAMFLPDAPAAAGLREQVGRAVGRNVQLYFGGRQLETQVVLPTLAPAPGAESVVAIRASLPPGSATLGMRLGEALGTLSLQADVDGVRVLEAVPVAAGGAPEPIPLTIEGASGLHTGLRYVWLGILHIVPKGLDHILFVLALCLLSLRWRPAVLQASAFTVAHSISLAMAVTGWVQVSSAVVEPLIALSIAVVAVENLLADRTRWWRLGLVFGFGLLHGLGFAGVLGALGLPQGQFALALLSFNVGVELAQIAVIAAAFGVAATWHRTGMLQEQPMRKWLSAVIAAAGLFWTVERLLRD